MGQIKKASISRCSVGQCAAAGGRIGPCGPRTLPVHGRAGPLRFRLQSRSPGHPVHSTRVDSRCFRFPSPTIRSFSVSSRSSLLWLSAHAGGWVAAKRQVFDEGTREDFGVILAAALTLLGLIIGFSFSMAINRYDQRKNLEEAEANAIGTEYMRADLLPAADGARVRELLARYTADRRSSSTKRSTPRRLRRSTARRPRSRTSCGPPCAARPLRSPHRSPRSRSSE